jgi:hypothetical protein
VRTEINRHRGTIRNPVPDKYSRYARFFAQIRVPACAGMTSQFIEPLV